MYKVYTIKENDTLKLTCSTADYTIAYKHLMYLSRCKKAAFIHNTEASRTISDTEVIRACCDLVWQVIEYEKIIGVPKVVSKSELEKCFKKVSFTNADAAELTSRLKTATGEIEKVDVVREVLGNEYIS